MSAKKPAVAKQPPSEATSDRIRAFLASMRPLRGCDAASREEYQLGRALIERLALSARDDDYPTLRLTAEQCADVLNFLSRSEPIEEEGWWQDDQDGPSHLCGFYEVIIALETSLRARGRKSS